MSDKNTIFVLETYRKGLGINFSTETRTIDEWVVE